MKPDSKLSLIVLSLLLAGCNADEQSVKTPPAPSVETLSLTSEPITPYVEFIGRTIAANHVDIIPHVGGELTGIFFKDGQFVEKGDLLYEIDPRPYEAKLKSAQAALAKAKAVSVLTKRNADRAAKLVKDKSISEMQYDSAVADNAEAQANIAVAEADLAEAQLNLDYTKIHAPFSGRIGFSQFKVGDRITAVVKNRLVTLSQVDPMRFNFDVDEKLYRQIRDVIDRVKKLDKKVNADINLKLSNGTVYPKSGSIYAVDNQVNPSTGSIHVQASFDNPDYVLVPGEYGNLTIKLKEQTIDGLLVPQSAIQQDQAGSFVMVVGDDDVVKPKYVELGQTYGTTRSVTSGLEASETIVVNGLQKIRPGIKVNATPVKESASQDDSGQESSTQEQAVQEK